MAAQPELRVVQPDEQPQPLVIDRQTGEPKEVTLESLAAENAHLRDELAELLKKFKGQSRELAELRRDRQSEAEDDKLWPLGLRMFIWHQRVANHPRAEWTAERFLMVRPFLRKRGLEECLRAIAGNLADPWRVSQKMTMWEDVFESVKKFERCRAKCPPDWTPPRGIPA